MTSKTPTTEVLQAQVFRLTKKVNALKASRKMSKLQTFSHMVMGGIMLMFFVGVALGVFVTIFRDEPVGTTMDYIMQLAKIVSLGYFIKAFGENIAKIVLSSIFGNRTPGTIGTNENESEENRYG